MPAAFDLACGIVFGRWLVCSAALVLMHHPNHSPCTSSCLSANTQLEQALEPCLELMCCAPGSLRMCIWRREFKKEPSRGTNTLTLVGSYPWSQASVGATVQTVLALPGSSVSSCVWLQIVFRTGMPTSKTQTDKSTCMLAHSVSI